MLTNKKKIEYFDRFTSLIVDIINGRYLDDEKCKDSKDIQELIVDSSWIDKFLYNFGTRELTMIITNLTDDNECEYIYEDFPLFAWEDLLEANSQGESIGRYYNKNIRNCYSRASYLKQEATPDYQFLYATNSSWINHFEYDVKLAVLIMVTIHGARYTYFDVPKDVWKDLCDTEEQGDSLGDYYNANIKGKFVLKERK